MKIVVDIYGADHSPDEIVKGAIKAVELDKELELILCGNELEIAKIVGDTQRISIINASSVITNDDTPTTAIREKKDSSLVVALNVLKSDSNVKGFVSAGSTGAVLTGAFMIIRRIKGISRPTLAPVLPTFTGGHMVLVDGGANVDCKSINLAHFAIMGSAYARTTLNIDNPRVALLSNGVEDKKGNELSREAFQLLRKLDINFVGNMEARELISGNYDVVVSDGFAGNIALKASEGMATYVFKLIKNAINEGGLRAKIGALLMKPTFYKLKSKLDYSNQGGAVFLGVDGVIVKSHGSSKANSICASILQAKALALSGVVEDIKSQLGKLDKLDV